MKPDENDRKNIFTGTWKPGTRYINIPGKGWKRVEVYGAESSIWEFEEDQRWETASGAMVFEGKLTEYTEGRPPEITEYAYYSGKGELYIERSDYTPDGFCFICCNERYRVEPIRKNQYRLYDLDREEEELERRFTLTRL